MPSRCGKNEKRLHNFRKAKKKKKGGRAINHIYRSVLLRGKDEAGVEYVERKFDYLPTKLKAGYSNRIRDYKNCFQIQ